MSNFNSHYPILPGRAGDQALLFLEGENGNVHEETFISTTILLPLQITSSHLCPGTDGQRNKKIMWKYQMNLVKYMACD